MIHKYVLHSKTVGKFSLKSNCINSFTVSHKPFARNKEAQTLAEELIFGLICQQQHSEEKFESMKLTCCFL